MMVTFAACWGNTDALAARHCCAMAGVEGCGFQGSDSSCADQKLPVPHKKAACVQPLGAVASNCSSGSTMQCARLKWPLMAYLRQGGPVLDAVRKLQTKYSLACPRWQCVSEYEKPWNGGPHGKGLSSHRGHA